MGSLLKLALPLIFAQLAQNSLSFVDTLMVGRLGNESLAGIALGSTLFYFVLIVLSGIILGVGPIVSQAIGADDRETASRAVRQGLWLGLLMFLPAFIFCWFAYPILIALGQSQDTASASAAYLRAISWGLLPALWIMSLRGFMEGNSNTRPIMIVSFLAIFANVFLNYVLMYGKFGFPELGLVGTGYASSLVYWFDFILFALYVRWKYRKYEVFRGLRSPDRKMLKELAVVGVPIGLTLGFEMSMFSAAAIAMGTLGKFELAAHQIALQSASISFMVPLGFAIAASVRVGHAIGRKSREGAAVAGRVGMIVCIAAMCVSALAFWLLPRLIIGAYIDLNDPENAKVIEFAVGFLAIAALFQIVDGLQVASSAALRGIKDTKAAMVLSLVSYLGVGVSAGWLFCFRYEWEGNGLWLGMTLGLATAALLLTLRFQYQVKRVVIEGELVD